jgi:hypothetical protein
MVVDILLYEILKLTNVKIDVLYGQITTIINQNGRA